jgi:hypothetical protein
MLRRIGRFCAEAFAGYLGLIHAVATNFRPMWSGTGLFWTPIWIALIFGAVVLGPALVLYMSVFQRPTPR